MTASPTVLVVDDEPSLVDAVATALRYEGFDVSEATSGRAGLAAAQEGRIDLIVLDVMLPDLDGFTIAERLRSTGNTTPVLFLTARDRLDDKAAGFAAGADDYLTKPFSLAELVMRVKAILRRATSDGPSDATLRFADVELDPDAHRARSVRTREGMVDRARSHDARAGRLCELLHQRRRRHRAAGAPPPTRRGASESGTPRAPSSWRRW